MLFCLSPLGATAKPPLRVQLAIHDYPPLIGEKLPYGGFLTRVVVEAFAKGGVTAKVVWVPNNRAISGVMDGLYDGSYGWAHAPERDAKLLYSKNPIYVMRMVFFQRRGQEYPWTRLEELSPFRIGATLGNHYSDEFATLQAGGVLKVETAAADAYNMKKLATGRIDLFPMEQEAGQMLADLTLAPVERDRIACQENAIWEVPTHLVIRRTHPHARELMACFERGFKALSASGRLKALIEETKQAIRDGAGRDATP